MWVTKEENSFIANHYTFYHMIHTEMVQGEPDAIMNTMIDRNGAIMNAMIDWKGANSPAIGHCIQICAMTVDHRRPQTATAMEMGHMAATTAPTRLLRSLVKFPYVSQRVD